MSCIFNRTYARLNPIYFYVKGRPFLIGQTGKSLVQHSISVSPNPLTVQSPSRQYSSSITTSIDNPTFQISWISDILEGAIVDIAGEIIGGELFSIIECIVTNQSLATNGTYTVKLTATGENGEQAETTVNIIIDILEIGTPVTITYSVGEGSGSVPIDNLDYIVGDTYTPLQPTDIIPPSGKTFDMWVGMMRNIPVSIPPSGNVQLWGDLNLTATFK